jgi:hypothetical protein
MSSEFVHNNKLHLTRAFEVGRNTSDLYAYHGTAIESIGYALTSGFLPPLGGWKNEFYFVPEGIGSHEGDFEHASNYAELNAVKWFVRKHLHPRLEMINMEVFNNYFMEFEPDFEDVSALLRELNRVGVRRAEVDILRKQARKTRKGVVLILSNKIKDDYEVTLGEGYDQYRIVANEGLPLFYITGIEPLGDYEYDFLAKIQEEVDTNS